MSRLHVGVSGLLATGIAVALTACAHVVPGPLTSNDAPDTDEAAGLHELRVGESFCFAPAVLHNPSRGDATLEAVNVRSGGGITVGPAQVLGPDRARTAVTGDSCPAAAPLAAHVVRPSAAHDAGVQVLLPIRVDRPGRGWISGITVTYRVSGTLYAVEDRSGLVACTYLCEGEETPGPLAAGDG